VVYVLEMGYPTGLSLGEILTAVSDYINDTKN